MQHSVVASARKTERVGPETLRADADTRFADKTACSEGPPSGTNEVSDSCEEQVPASGDREQSEDETINGAEGDEHGKVKLETDAKPEVGPVICHFRSFSMKFRCWLGDNMSHWKPRAVSA